MQRLQLSMMINYDANTPTLLHCPILGGTSLSLSYPDTPALSMRVRILGGRCKLKHIPPLTTWPQPQSLSWFKKGWKKRICFSSFVKKLNFFVLFESEWVVFLYCFQFFWNIFLSETYSNDHDDSFKGQRERKIRKGQGQKLSFELGQVYLRTRWQNYLLGSVGCLASP